MKKKFYQTIRGPAKSTDLIFYTLLYNLTSSETVPLTKPESSFWLVINIWYPWAAADNLRKKYDVSSVAGEQEVTLAS
jgi:hypothetical protein